MTIERKEEARKAAQRVAEQRYVADEEFALIDTVDAAISAYEEALSNAGFVIVPKEPTREMTLAWAIKSPAFKGTGAAHNHAREVYAAMLSAMEE